MNLEGVGFVCQYPRLDLDPLMEAIGTVYCEEAQKRTIDNLEVDGKISKRAFR